MIDYLYQLSYELKPASCSGTSCNGSSCNGIVVVADEEQEPNHIPEPDSPVAQAIQKIEYMSAPFADHADDEWVPRTKKAKKKKRITSSWGLSSLPLLDYPPPPMEDSAPYKSKKTQLNIHAQMYALADKYGIHDLKDFARVRFAETALHDWNDSGFPLAVQTVYSSTPNNDHGLRDVVVATLSKHRELMDKFEVESLVKEVNGLAFGLLKSTWGI
jgi:hypothetical protein